MPVDAELLEISHAPIAGLPSDWSRTTPPSNATSAIVTTRSRTTSR